MKDFKDSFKKMPAVLLALFYIVFSSAIFAQGGGGSGGSGSGSSTDCPCETKEDSTGLCSGLPKKNCDDSDNGKCCCGGEEFDGGKQCCKGGSIEDLWEMCIHSSADVGTKGHSFISLTNLNSGEHKTYGTRPGSRASPEYTEDGKQGSHDGLYNNYEKNESKADSSDDYDKDYSKNCTIVCGEPSAPADPGWDAINILPGGTGNCSTFATGFWNDSNNGSDKDYTHNDMGAFYDNPSALQDTIDDDNKEKNKNKNDEGEGEGDEGEGEGDEGEGEGDEDGGSDCRCE